MFRRFTGIPTADKLRQKAQTDDQVARALLTQAAEVNVKAREKRDQALELDRQEVVARLRAEMYRSQQVFEKAKADAKAANEDSTAALAVAQTAQADFEAAVQYETDAYQMAEAARRAYEAFTGEVVNELGETQPDDKYDIESEDVS